MFIFAQRYSHEVNNELANLAFHDLTPTTTIIPPGLKRLLGLGLNYCPSPKPTQKSVLSDSLQELYRSIRLKIQFRNENDAQFKPNKLYVRKTDYKPKSAPIAIEKQFLETNNSLDYYTMVNKKRNNLNPAQRNLLIAIKKRPDLRIMMTDKNLGPALITHERYLDLCLDHLKDTSTYEIINDLPDEILKKLQSIVRNFYRTKVSPMFSYDYDTSAIDNAAIITADIANTNLNYFYALAKIHKPTLCIRPIISNSGSVLQGLSRWLNHYLQPYARKTSSYIKDSDDMVSILNETTIEPDEIMISFDVVSLYTNIQSQIAIPLIRDYLISFHKMDKQLCCLLMEGLHIVMNFNYFQFGDLLLKQITGTAMGTSCAPTYATIYLAAVEDQFLIPKFEQHIRLFKRFIDDGFLLWKFHSNHYSFQHFLATFKQYSKLAFTFESHENNAIFLDLCIYTDDKTGFYCTKTYQKELNLYLYIPSSSAHSPGVFKGMIFGLIQKYYKQNTKAEDFQFIVKKLFRRLIARGHKKDIIKPIFLAAMTKTTSSNCPTQGIPDKLNQVFFKVPFDKNGPSKTNLRNILQFPKIEKLIQSYGIDKITMCYTKPDNLRKKLCPSKINPQIKPTPADVLSKHLVHSVGFCP